MVYKNVLEAIGHTPIIKLNRIAEKGCAVDADGLSTTCLALGVEQGIKLMEELDGVEAVFVDAEGSIHTTSGAPELTTK